MIACPVCGGRLDHSVYRDDESGSTKVVEAYHECPEGHYSRSCTYSLIEVVVGDKAFGWTFYEPAEKVETAQAKLAVAIRLAKSQITA